MEREGMLILLFACEGMSECEDEERLSFVFYLVCEYLSSLFHSGRSAGTCSELGSFRLLLSL